MHDAAGGSHKKLLEKQGIHCCAHTYQPPMLLSMLLSQGFAIIACNGAFPYVQL